MLTVYGIRECDSCRQARKWLDRQGIAHRFHDLRRDGLEEATVRAWLGSGFADQLLNRRSATWRALTEQQRTLQGAARVALLLEHPTLIKRPVWVDREVIAVGFDPERLQQRLAARGVR